MYAIFLFIIFGLTSSTSCVNQTTGPYYDLILNLQQEIQNNVIQQIIDQFFNFVIQALNIERFNFIHLLDTIHSFLPQLGEALLYQIRNLIALVLSSSALNGSYTRVGEEIDNLLDTFQEQIINFLFNSLHLIFPSELESRDFLTLFHSFGINIENILDSLKPKILEAIHQISLALNISNERNNLVDYIVFTFGLGQVWSIIQSLGNQVVIQFTNISAQLLFAGQQIWNSAQDIFNQLKDDLTNHAGDAVNIVAQAIASLNQILIIGNGK
ncbi:unnamed protein product [Brachionus calyciflorus]|uniref:Uncharacterized protein n=1 Tax=Brachionus calyciflorus TaxID=104777 RepID=A0A814NVD0_9BILA|nr:unnamed protein product [Brachionus calyciflorus]